MRTFRSKVETQPCRTTILQGCRLVGLMVLVASVLVIATVSFAAQPDTAKNVLILESFSGHSGDFVTLLKPELRARNRGPVDYYVENLESQRFKESGYLRNLAETMRSSYADHKLDLVVVANYPALQFAVTYRDRMFPGVPIVFLAVAADRLKQQKLWPNVTGVTASVDIQATIDLALGLHPGTTTIAVISNASSEFESYWLAAVQAKLQQQREKVQEIDLVGLPTPQLLQRVASLPPHTIILVQLTPQDSVQPVMENDDVVMAIARLRPTYCFAAPFCMNRGGIGTADFDEREQVSLAAGMAARILGGERADNIPVVNGNAHQVLVDWRELNRWNIAESALPPGSVVLNREPTLWERDRKYIIAAMVVILLQFLLIAALLWQRARKRKVEAVLSESETRFRAVSDTAPVMIWMSDTKKQCTYFNKPWLDFTGRSFESELGDGWTAAVHPADLPACLDTYTRFFDRQEPFRMEYRLRRYDGQYRWVLDIGVPRFGADRLFAGFIGSAVDITDQKMAQDALVNVSGRLIEAQENERTRIARDLHDDICQRLAVLSVELEQANRNGAPPSTKRKLEEIRQHCAEIAGDVQALSHELHSSKLDYLGVAAAIGAFCREFASQHQADIRFKAGDVPPDLPRGISLCLFRVTQEALHNAIKYSGTRQAAVTITGAADEIELTVQDSGAGFAVEEAKRNRGLGLVSMQERVNLVRGRFRIDSAPGAGTKITAVVPLPHVSRYGADENTKTAAAQGVA